ncbi:EAL domain-containing protein [Gallaecimonas sp. GXIMD4217]|uniref:bifunctional diguanylate cyclase/phosphodiesterase n=1 Tax=Gallaecimonas sp. GXIMD4217 TaxID=3131927 RepID=UPI00311B0494
MRRELGRGRSLRLRLLLPMVSLVMLLSLGFGLVEHHLDQQVLKGRLADKADLLAELVRAEPAPSLAALAGKSGIRALVLVRSDDQRILASSKPAQQGQGLQQLADLWLPTDQVLGTEPLDIYQGDQALFVRPLASGQDQALLLAWLDGRALNHDGNGIFWRIVLMSVMASLALILVLYWLLSRQLLLPLEHIGAVIRRRAEGDLQARTHLELDSEIGELADCFNALLDQEAEADNRLKAAHDRSLEQEQLFKRIFQVLPDILSITRASDGTYVDVNALWEQASGHKREEAIGRTALELGIWCDDGDRQALVQALKEQGQIHNLLVPFRRTDGSVIQTEVSGCLFSDKGTQYILLACRDMTQRRKSEAQLRLMSTVFQASRDGIIITDAEQRIQAVNAAFSQITGYREQQVLGQKPAIFDPGNHEPSFYEAMWQALNDKGFWQGEIWNRRQDGDIYPQWLSITRVNDEQGQPSHYVAVFSDISERKEAEERIAFLAYHDPLTGLPNRALLEDRFNQAQSQARRQNQQLAVLFLDLDRFKGINDSLGHGIGDELLKAVVARLEHLVRSSDTLSRQGGDEFILILQNISDSTEVAYIAERILEQFESPFQVQDYSLNIGTSIGIALYPDDGEDFETLLKKADTAMYHVKDSGRGAFSFFTPAMDQQACERLQMEAALRQALKNGELSLHYQPQVALGSGRIVGVEALMRWSSPQLGEVPPSRFIPLAEETGLILSLGRWLLEEACSQMVSWRQQLGFDGRMAVNLSVKQVSKEDFLPQLAGILNRTGLPAQQLELELTESLLMQDVGATLEVVRQLKAMDVRLAIDDFGTGYSSLSYLKRFAVDTLKVDRSFVSGLGEDDQARILVRAIVQMAHSLDLSVVAEGVENTEQLAVLLAEGFDHAQGYHFGRPMAAEQVTALLQRGYL